MAKDPSDLETDPAGPADDAPPQLPYAPALAAVVRPVLGHSGIDLKRFHSLHVAGTLLPVAAGLAFFGWRALVLMLLLMSSAFLAALCWRQVGLRGRQLRVHHTLYLALLLALMLPAHWVGGPGAFPGVPGTMWAAVAGAGLLLVSLEWLLGGVGSGPLHPAILAFLLLALLFRNALEPHWILQRNHLFAGDLADVRATEPLGSSADGWAKQPLFDQDSIQVRDPAAYRLTRCTTGHGDEYWLSLYDLPPLEDLILGAHPGPIGAGSGICVIVGGLFLLYRGVIDFRIPLLIALAALPALLVLPIPVVDAETHVTWTWLAMRLPDFGAAGAVSLANYELMAGPMLFMAFFLATAPAVRPMARRARLIYAVLIGVAAAALQLYFSVSLGPYVALLAVSLLTPAFDRFFRQHPVI